jgi:hypothetical protein
MKIERCSRKFNLTADTQKDEFYPIGKIIPGKMKWNVVAVVKSITFISSVNSRDGK